MPTVDQVILFTPPGPAAIAVVRLVGPGVGPFLARHFSRPVTASRCVHGELRDESGAVLDDPLVVRPAGLEFADLNVHGGPWVVQSVLNLARRAGFQPVNCLPDGAAGFAKKDGAAAPLDGRDEMEGEVLTALPFARTGLALRTLLHQPQAWRELVSRARASPEGVRAELVAALADRSLVHLLSLPRVAIVGAPNVGKSTLANQLFVQERSITADLPGTTRDWVGEVANVDGLAVMLVDTPGFRETPDAIEREAIARGRAEVGRANLVVLVLDPTQPPEPEQGALVRAFPTGLRVLNKSDRVPTSHEAGAAGENIRTVATTGQGVDQLRRAILNHFGCLDLAQRARIWTDRQARVASRCVADEGGLNEMYGTQRIA